MKKYVATVDDLETPFQIEEKGDVLTVISESRSWTLDVHSAGPSHYSVIHEGKSYDIRFFREGNSVSAFLQGEHIYFTLEDSGKKSSRSVGAGFKPASATAGPAEIRALMPGKVVKVMVKRGDKVDRGSPLLVVEAMKMENEMTSPKEGKVTELKVAEGASVESGALLAVIE